MNWWDKMIRSLRQFAGELSPACHEAARWQSAALENPLPLRKRIGLRIHLLLCKWCRRYGQQLRFLRGAARHHDEHESALPEHKLGAEARERIKQRLGKERK